VEPKHIKGIIMKTRNENLRKLQFRTGAGAHVKSNKALRRKNKVVLSKEL
jgi:hypothetical protein